LNGKEGREGKAPLGQQPEKKKKKRKKKRDDMGVNHESKHILAETRYKDCSEKGEKESLTQDYP